MSVNDKIWVQLKLCTGHTIYDFTCYIQMMFVSGYSLLWEQNFTLL